mmetsp:Transcript_68368/g.191616  ORF Transcript_68368/g.191616 Transcript_68368/m.191616 type:complete len:286 (-) Transcript_68368:134-991(-)
MIVRTMKWPIFHDALLRCLSETRRKSLASGSSPSSGGGPTAPRTSSTESSSRGSGRPRSSVAGAQPQGILPAVRSVQPRCTPSTVTVVPSPMGQLTRPRKKAYLGYFSFFSFLSFFSFFFSFFFAFFSLLSMLTLPRFSAPCNFGASGFAPPRFSLLRRTWPGRAFFARPAARLATAFSDPMGVSPRAFQTSSWSRANTKANRQEPQTRMLNHLDFFGPTEAIQPAPHFAFVPALALRPRVSSQRRRPHGLSSPVRIPGNALNPVGAAGSASAISLSLKAWMKAL